MKKKLNWRKIWKEFDSLIDAAEPFYSGEWKEQKIIFYSVVNKNLPSRNKLYSAHVLNIESGFKNWFRRERHNADWKNQKKVLMKLVNSETA